MVLTDFDILYFAEMEVERTLLAAPEQCAVLGYSFLQGPDQPLPVRSNKPAVGATPGNLNAYDHNFAWTWSMKKGHWNILWNTWFSTLNTKTPCRWLDTARPWVASHIVIFFFLRGTICFREWQTPLIYGIIFGPLLLCCQQVYLFFAHQGFVDPQYRCDVLETDDIL